VNGYLTLPASLSGEVAAVVGPRLLAGIAAGPGLFEHRATWPAPRAFDAGQLLAVLEAVPLHGRGGAGFPFARKFATAVASGRRRSVVVNAAECEPASAKDSVLMTAAPHLVLDGAEAVARALGAPGIHVVVGHDRPAVQVALDEALAERELGLPFALYTARSPFVGGQETAVLELLEGRDNVPVTSWEPASVAGLGGRPTLVSNAETFAQVAALLALGPAAYAELGTPTEPGTTLLTVAGDGPHGAVIEAPYGVELGEVLEFCGYDPASAMLLGGYHGTWVPAGAGSSLPVSRQQLRARGLHLGAGVVLPLDPQTCPVVVTAGVTGYLASVATGQCGPCRNGLPALSEAVGALADGAGRAATRRTADLAALVTGRGACAHPDGTARLVQSMLRSFPAEVRTHELGHCSFR
jgi:NADH:ubiquinone oxidoreductase subunit F (NADH-binding)